MKCAVNNTITYIKHLAQDLAGCDPNCAVLAIMFDLAIPVNHSGFEYLKAAILMQYENPTLDLVNDIYIAVAETHGNISADMVSSSIRRAVKVAWDHGEVGVWDRYLPAVLTNKKRPPTNAEMIAGLARVIELWQGCANAYLRQLCKEVVSSGSK